MSLQGATADQLVDDWASARDNAFWPTDGRLHLDGLIDSRLGGAEPATVDQRLGWLRSQYKRNASKIPAPFAAQPYEQLASVYRHAGQDTEARRVAIARRSDLRKYGSRSPPRRIRSGTGLLDKSIKYGYQTWRAVAGLISLYVIVLALSIFAQHHGLIVPVGNLTNLHPTPVRRYVSATTRASTLLATPSTPSSRSSTSTRQPTGALAGHLVGMDLGTNHLDRDRARMGTGDTARRRWYTGLARRE